MTGIAGGGTVQLTMTAKGDLPKKWRSTRQLRRSKRSRCGGQIVAAFTTMPRKVSSCEQEMQKTHRGASCRGSKLPL